MYLQKKAKTNFLFKFLRNTQMSDLELVYYCPQAGLALPFPFDEKEAKILSKRTLSRAF